MKEIKSDEGNNKNDNNVYAPIVFVNTPISDALYDVIGFDSQVKTLRAAIDDGANMIGIIANYGTGKSSMTELLSQSFSVDGNKPIKINMWDCLGRSTACKDKLNENISNLTKSFLYQLSNGKDRKFGSYINKILSKNYGNISFATNKANVFLPWIISSAVCFSIYKMLGISNTGVTKYLWSWCNVIAPFLKMCSPFFLLASAICLFLGIKDICIAFSHWNMPNKKEPEINDVFETYNLIIEHLKPENGKQLIFIDDLDRINEKEIIIEFLKELYRFQESLGDLREKFVFVISIKPESELEMKITKDEIDTNSDDADKKDGALKEYKGLENFKDDKIYSKIFDVILSLKPIHFDDYDSVLLGLIKTDANKMNELSKMNKNFVFDNNLPSSFKWIKKGTNLTLRDLKDRLNQTIATYVSLKNKTYKVKTSVEFEACTAVSFLESQYSKEYYTLIKDEDSFAKFMKDSYRIINESEEAETQTKLAALFEKVFDKSNYSECFINDFCSMVASRIFNDDFRMYFYTYPNGSHIKTTEEREICDMLLYPNQNNNFEELDEIVNRAYADGENVIVREVLKSLDKYSKVIIMNEVLFKQAVSVSFNKSFDAFDKNVLEVLESDNDMSFFWSKICTLSDGIRERFIEKSIEKIISIKEPSNVIKDRKDIIKGLENNLEEFANIFINDSEYTPQITETEINLITNFEVAIKLINPQKLDESNAEYIINLVNKKPLSKDKNILEKSYVIMKLLSEILPPDEIAEHLLKFMFINHLRYDDLFSVICETDIDPARFVEYINSFKPEEFSDAFLESINDKGIVKNLNDEHISHLMKNHLFYAPIIYLIENDELNRINPYLKLNDLIVAASNRINKSSHQKVLIMRKHCYFKCANKEYVTLFFGEFPLITQDEYIYVRDLKEAISLINTSAITVENGLSLLECIYRREYSREEIAYLFEHLFDEKANANCVNDENVRKYLIDNFDFKAISFKKLTAEERTHIYTIIKDACNITNASEAIELTKKLDCFIPELESLIQFDVSMTKDYLELITSIEELSELAVEWINKSEKYITVAMSEQLCKSLYDNGLYGDYIVADCLRKQDMVIDGSIEFSYYISIYKNVEEMFGIMSEHWDFLEKAQEEADLEEFDEKLLVPIFKTKQSKRFFEYIFSDKTEQSLKEKYLIEFGKFKTEDDSKAFQVLICKAENMELLGDYKIYHHIHENLWSSNPTHKRLFTKAWNARWKKELDEKEIIILD